MKIEPASHQPFEHQKVKPPKAGGKSIKHLLNLDTKNTPNHQSIISRKVTLSVPDQNIQEAINVITLRDAIFRAATPSELNDLEKKTETLKSKEEAQRLQTLIHEQLNKLV